MTDLLDTIQRLEETHAEILRVEKAMAQHNDLGLALTLGSLHKRKEYLDGVFGQLTHKVFLDICDYRLITTSENRPPVSAISRFLGDFQTLFSTIFDALVNGPKERARIAPETVEESTFNFGYSYVGSVGFTLTMPNDRLLIGESSLDNTIHTIFQIIEAKDTSEISTYAKKIGVAGVRQVYKWADDHVRNGFDADIKWRRENEVRAHRVIQVPELKRLQETINKTSDECEEVITLNASKKAKSAAGAALVNRPHRRRLTKKR